MRSADMPSAYEHHVLRVHLRRHALAERDAPPIRAQLVPCRVVEIVDHGAVREQVREQARLGAKVLAHRPMIVEVIAREVGERHDVESHALDSVLMQRVGRHLHGDSSDLRIDERAKHPLQLDGSRCRQPTACFRTKLPALAADQHPQRPD